MRPSVLLLCHLWSARGLTAGRAPRRSFLGGSVASVASILAPRPVAAAGPEDREALRAALLSSIASGASDGEILGRIRELERLDPSRGRGATSPSLAGEWRLLWSNNTAAFSPLLLSPLKPESYQLLGAAADARLGAPGRIAQVLDVPRFPVPLQLELSSGASPAAADGRTLVVAPPFKFAAVVGGRTWTLVEADSDASFRKANARTAEAQNAPRNAYVQTYLEGRGAGDLRVSVVASGDPVIVGSTFVHQRL